MDLPLNHLSTGEMISITKSWIEDPSFASIAEAKALLPQVKDAHAALVAARPKQAQHTDADVEALIADARSLDTRHDHALRAVLYLLLAAREHALALDPPAADEAAAFDNASTRLFPAGAGGTQASWSAEEGNAHRAAGDVKTHTDLGKLFAALRLDKKTPGNALFDDYVGLASELGDADRAKTQAQNASAEAAMPATLRTARFAWIDLVGTVVRVLRHAKGDAAKTYVTAVVQVAKKAQARALAAAAAAKKAGQGAPPPAPAG